MGNTMRKAILTFALLLLSFPVSSLLEHGREGHVFRRFTEFRNDMHATGEERSNGATRQNCEGGTCNTAHREAAPAGPWPLPPRCSHLQPHLGFSTVSSFATRPFVVGSFLKWFDVQGFHESEISNCSVPCLFLHLPSGVSEDCVEAVDLVLLTAAMHPPATSVKSAWQLWGYYSLESSAIYPEMHEATHMAQFDLELSTRLGSHVPMTFAPRMPDVIRRPLTEDKSQAGLVLYLQSNCVEWRDAYVSDLMKHVQVDSLGKCLKNGRYPENVGTVELLARYKFFIAFENSIAPDFVTERVFNAWIAGAVPIYLGAPNVEDFAPHAHSLIHAKAFADAGNLAEYLNYLDSNSTAWEEYLRFKDPATPLSEGYLRASSYSFYAPDGERGARSCSCQQ